MSDLSSNKNPLQLNDLLPKLTRSPAGRSVKSIIEKTLGLSYLAKGYSQLNTEGEPEKFVSESFNKLDIQYQIVNGKIDNIPSNGSVIVVANHPYGAVDGMAMIHLLRQRRKDIKIMANGFLKRVPEIKDIVISVNPYGHSEAKKQNTKAMRECLHWLDNNGLIFMFPAGDVSSINLSEFSIADADWDSKVARLAIKSGASIVPAHISGRNSAAFYLAGAIHPALKTLLYPRQILNKRGSTIEISLGTIISSKRLQKLNNVKEISALLKSRTYMLSDLHKKHRDDNTPNKSLAPVIKPVSEDRLTIEITSLTDKQLLVESGDMQVFYASASQIPSVLQEIGRLREHSFREIGEGSGNNCDVDIYDNYYIQLFIWNKKTREVVGGYRLGLADEITNKFKLKGLYSYSLFKFSPTLIKRSPPSIELGRSFVRTEYQRSFSPLMLLWKGISQFVFLHPKYCILFGPVSISNAYSKTSQQLLINFLKNNRFNTEYGRLVKARTPYKNIKEKNITISGINTMSIDELSALISSLEEDGKDIPVLIKQYLKMGGEMLGFNRDTDFGDCIDGLIRVDLRQTNEKVLAKYMGKDQVKKYFSYHRKAAKKAG